MKLFNCLSFIIALTVGNTINAQTTKITLSSPSTEKNYLKGDTIWIEGNVVSDGPLHDVNIYVTDLNDSTTVYFNKNYHTHGSKQDFKQFFILSLTDKTMLRVIIRTFDHDNNITSRKQQVFKCNFPKENSKKNQKSKSSKKASKTKPAKSKGKS
ncbi:MAG: hypothetical protein Q8K70_04490 [Bacteroidota bacterium]|nr:hypothetical protein [Bacteroidota bacterium]